MKLSLFRTLLPALALSLAPLPAAIIHTTYPVPVSIGPNQAILVPIGGINFVMRTDYYGDPSQPYFQNGNTYKTAAASYPFLAKYLAGDMIDSSLAYLSVGTFLNSGPWSAGGDGYVGLYFRASDNLDHYGWFHLLYDSSAHTLSVTESAYESSANVGIQITAAAPPSAVPEPSALALAGAGLLALAVWRRRSA